MNEIWYHHFTSHKAIEAYFKAIDTLFFKKVTQALQQHSNDCVVRDFSVHMFNMNVVCRKLQISNNRNSA